MKYTNYFAGVVKQHGALNIHQEALENILNLVHLEAKIRVYETLNPEHRYSLSIGKLQAHIDEITDRLEPRIIHNIWHNGASVHPKRKVVTTNYAPWPDRDPYLEPKKDL